MAMSRRELLGLNKNPKLITNISPYANKTLPKNGSRSSLGLTPITGTLSRIQAIHLLRRSMFSYTMNDVKAMTGLTVSAAVDSLLSPTLAELNPAPPVRFYQTEMDVKVPSRDVAYKASWADKRITVDSAVPNDFFLNVNPIYIQRRLGLKSWTVENMLFQKRTLVEKMYLFWHNHFSTESDIVQDPLYLYNHHAMLRASSLGNFKDLVRNVTLDPAMLFYLNNRLNTKNAPDENYARELKELFTLGVNSGYTEDDIKAAARVLTGHTIGATYNYAFDSNKHDTGDKQFSSFYSNTKITGKTAIAGASELDELLNMIFAKQDVVAQFIVRKLYRYFVYYTIDAFTEENVIKPLADIFKANNWDIKPVLKKLFESEHFFDSVSQSCNIKNPMDYVLSPLRQFESDFSSMDPVAFIEDKYKILNTIRAQMGNLQMEPLDPPNVAGWQAYYQTPQFYEIWVNSDTYPKRLKTIDLMMNGNYNNQSGGVALVADFLNWCKNNISNPGDPNVLVAELSEYLLGIGLSLNTRNAYKTSYLLTGQSSDIYWTTAWNNWVAAPTDANLIKLAYANRLKPLLAQLMKLEEYFLN
jgi:uncharacterized protein (DUF1800 family)